MDMHAKPKKHFLWAGVVLALSFFVFMSVAVPALSWANPLDEKQKELQQVEQKKAATAQQLNQTKKQERNLTTELNTLERQLEQAENELASLNQKMQVTENDLRQTTAELQKAETELAEQTDILGERLRAMQENGTVSYIEVLLSSGDFGDLLNRIDLMKEIIAQDVTLMENIKKKQAEIAIKKHDLEKKKAQLVTLQGSVRTKKENIEVASRSKQRVLTDIVKQKEA
ncbi:MAG: hypothetical protein GX489_04670, partial [Firmicutes bacterium]|nr:hypothetical protein [Bacillota bacterium]